MQASAQKAAELSVDDVNSIVHRVVLSLLGQDDSVLVSPRVLLEKPSGQPSGQSSSEPSGQPSSQPSVQVSQVTTLEQI